MTMAKARSITESVVVQHIARIQEALRDDDLGLALKWVLRQDSRVERPQELISKTWSVQNTGLYSDAKTTDRRFETRYRSDLDAIGQEIGRLADSYRKRQEAGLVLVLQSASATATLRNVGFKVKTVEYRLLESRRLTIVDELTQDQIAWLRDRDSYVDSKVEEILHENPTLVVTPLFERVYMVYRYPKTSTNPAINPEGIILNRKLQEEALKRKIKCPSLLGHVMNEAEISQWRDHNIPHTRYNQELREAVKGALNINYQPSLQ